MPAPRAAPTAAKRRSLGSIFLSLWQTTYQHAEIFQLQSSCQQPLQSSLGKPWVGRTHRGGAARTGTPLLPQPSSGSQVAAQLRTTAGLGTPFRPARSPAAGLPFIPPFIPPPYIHQKHYNRNQHLGRSSRPLKRSFSAPLPAP